MAVRTISPLRLIRAIASLLLALAPALGLAQSDPKVVRVGIVNYYEGQRARLFVEAMSERGWIEGRNVQYLYRWVVPHGKAVLEELARVPVDVFVVFGNDIARAATQVPGAIPIVVATADYPVESGLVPSLSRPGGQITGVSNWVGRSLDAKRLALLKDAAPGLKKVAVFSTQWMQQWPETKAAAEGLGVQFIDLGPGEMTQLESVLKNAVDAGANGIFVMDYPRAFRDDHVSRITELAIKYRLPLVHSVPSAADKGALITYASDVREARRRAASLVDRILRGAKPGDLPFEDPASLRLVVNLDTARAIGLTVPPSLLIQATQIIDRGAIK